MAAIKQFEIYWTNLDPTLGSEIQKTRPCIVVSPTIMNDALRTIIVVPLTGTIISWPFRTKVKVKGKIVSAACDQLRSISKERLGDKVSTLSTVEQKIVSEILISIFGE